MAANANANANDRDQQIYEQAIKFHQEALDDLVSVNSLLSVAVFVGLTFSVSELSLESRSHCKVPAKFARRLLINEVVSFACFLLSSLVAKALKMHLSTYLFSELGQIKKQGSKFLRCSMLLLSTLGSIFGCIFLIISMVYVVEIRLGKLSCEKYAVRAAGGLIAIVSLALVIYISFTFSAIYRSVRLFTKRRQ